MKLLLARPAILALCILFSARPSSAESGRVFTRPVAPASVVRTALTVQESAQTLNLSVALKMRSMAELQARINSGEKISQAEMEAKYLPLQSDYDQVKNWLVSRGLEIRTDLVDSNHTNIFVRGNVASIAQALEVHFAEVATTSTAVPVVTSAITEPTVPDEIRTKIIGVVGLQPHLRSAAANSATGIDLINNVLMTPTDVEIIYGNTTSLTGAGQTIAVYGTATPATADLSGYISEVSSSATLSNYTVVPVDGGSNSTDQADGNVEAWGDVEMVLGLAPGAKVRMYAVANSGESTAQTDVFAQVLNDQKSDPTITVFTISVGTPENDLPTSLRESLSQQLAQMAAAGITVCAGSGDSGSNPNPTAGDYGYSASYPLDVYYPASDPNVTAVGGTQLNLVYTGAGATTTWNETVWPGSGGGLSPAFTRPTWQTGTGVPAGNQRCVPDVSMAEGGYYMYINGALGGFAGTSASSPVFAAHVALLNQARANAGLAPLGLLGPHIYPLIGTAAFNDITQSAPASNGGQSIGNGAYAPTAGYDLCSGIGTPIFDALETVLTGGTLPSGPPPTVSVTQGVNQTVTNGSGAVTLSASASAGASYQWALNGVAIAGATGDTLTVYPTAATEGAYSVTATSSGGSVTAAAGTLGVTTDAWIVNLSSRAYAKTGANLLIAGFVTTGPDTKQVLIRGIGPSLSAFGVTGFLTDPKLTLLSGTTTVATTTSWSTTLDATFNQVGAFGLTAGSHDGAFLESLTAGAYTAQVVSATTNQGVALAEVYDADSLAPTDRLVNISARAFVGTGGNILIGGFVIGGNTPQTVLIRATGPALASFGLTGTLPTPVLTVYNNTGTLIATNTGWGNAPVINTAGGIAAGELQPATPALFTKVGAFSLTAGSADSAVALTLPPGAYTAQIADKNGQTGIALIEIYEVR